MAETSINMLTADEIAELVQIRKKMEELQARYDALVAKAHPFGRPGLALPELPTSGATASRAASPAAAAPVTAPDAGKTESQAKLSTPDPPATSKPLGGMKLTEAVITVLRDAGQPLPFEIIFKRLQEGGAALPAEKPMLAVRQILYNQKLFTVERNRFRLING